MGEARTVGITYYYHFRNWVSSGWVGGCTAAAAAEEETADVEAADYLPQLMRVLLPPRSIMTGVKTPLCSNLDVAAGKKRDA